MYLGPFVASLPNPVFTPSLGDQTWGPNEFNGSDGTALIDIDCNRPESPALAQTLPVGGVALCITEIRSHAVNESKI